MINFKWNYGIAVSLVVGLSSCMMNEPVVRDVDYTTNKSATKQTVRTETRVNTNNMATTPRVTTQTTRTKVSVSEPVQRTGPGPKRVAAPQIPVIE